jgi:hypothetical protein
VYLNWALGLKAVGCDVVWAESLPGGTEESSRARVHDLKRRLSPYGVKNVAVFPWDGQPLPTSLRQEGLDLFDVDADLLLNVAYDIPPTVVERFPRSVLLDIDPGLAQVWMANGRMRVPTHDLYFTIGETVGTPEARFPDAGLDWQYTPPCIALDWWGPHPPGPDAAFTTVSHWQMDEWEEDEGEMYCNGKRAGFLPFLDLPRHVTQPLELALRLAADEEDERVALLERGWRVRDAATVAATPWDYQRYIQNSLGEFSCVKPSCIRRQNAWMSDRTLCYLASAKPAVIQHTGPSRFLPDASGLFRFRELNDAIHALEVLAADYDRHGRLARQLAEEHFDARRVAQRVVERALA